MKRTASPIFLKFLGSIILTVFLTAIGFGQDRVEMADTMRSNGKIYIVVAVCLSILIGLFIYVATIDRKLRKWEKEEGEL